jgi:hypothetical protein
MEWVIFGLVMLVMLPAVGLPFLKATEESMERDLRRMQPKGAKALEKVTA